MTRQRRSSILGLLGGLFWASCAWGAGFGGGGGLPSGGTTAVDSGSVADDKLAFTNVNGLEESEWNLLTDGGATTLHSHTITGVDSSAITDGGIGAADLADNSVDAGNIAAGAVGDSELGAIDSSWVADGALSPDDINGFAGKAINSVNGAGLSLVDAKNLALTVDVGTNLSGNGFPITGTAGENLSAGDVAAMRTNGKWYQGDADSTALAGVAMAWVPTAITSGNSGTLLLWAFVRDDAGNWTLGKPVYADTIAGGVTQTEVSNQTGNVVRIMGYALDDSTLWFSPSEWAVR